MLLAFYSQLPSSSGPGGGYAQRWEYPERREMGANSMGYAFYNSIPPMEIVFLLLPGDAVDIMKYVIFFGLRFP